MNTAATLPPIPRPPEKAVQAQIRRLFMQAGGVVRTNSQYRASGVSVGIPDLHVSFPRARKWFWFEVKRPIAKGFHFLKPETWQPEPLRPAQELFRADCIATDQPHFWGGYREAEEALIAIGAAERFNGVLFLRQRVASTSAATSPPPKERSVPCD